MSKILVKSKGEQFRRADILFTRQGIELDTAKLKKGQLDAIEAEPQLVVTEVADDDGKAKAKK